MSAPKKTLDPYTLRYLAREMRAEAVNVWSSRHTFAEGARGRLICWARECESLARAEKRRRGSEGQ